jgi:hypothetical protein
MEKVYFTPNLWGLEHITSSPMKMDFFLLLELSKTGQILKQERFLPLFFRSY